MGNPDDQQQRQLRATNIGIAFIASESDYDTSVARISQQSLDYWLSLVSIQPRPRQKKSSFSMRTQRTRPVYYGKLFRH